jgi:hypothetical protein
MSVSTSPPGISSSSIANILVQRSELYSKECNAPSGTGGFIQLIDFDRDADVARVGFARFVRDEASALRDGLCFVEDTYLDPQWQLPTLYRPKWPKGLPPPMPQPWKVSVVRSARLRDRDFDLKTDRIALLERFAAGADLADFGGVFYMDEKRGYMHGYAPLAFIVNYDSATSFNAIPIRETEITIQMNDPEHPNCVGSFLGNSPDLPSSCEGNSTNRSWGCYPGNCEPTQLAPATIKGYFLVAEMEQVHTILAQTLCHLFPGNPPPSDWRDWGAAEACRNNPKWDPTDPLNGMPPGDFCAETNDVATPTCHDAFRSISYSTFQAFPIRDGTCTLK